MLSECHMCAILGHPSMGSANRCELFDKESDVTINAMPLGSRVTT